MAQTTEQRLQISRSFKAPRDRVFRAWTDPAELKRWFRADPGYTVAIAEVDLRVGGRYRLGMKPPDSDPYVVGGVYREIRPPERLVFTWKWEWSKNGDPETLVTLDFHGREGRTEVVLTHERLPTEEERDKHEHGWIGCLDQLAAFLEEAR